MYSCLNYYFKNSSQTYGELIFLYFFFVSKQNKNCSGEVSYGNRKLQRIIWNIFKRKVKEEKMENIFGNL